MSKNTAKHLVIIKRILVSDFAKFRNRMMQPSGVRHRITSQNLVAARNEEWKRIRSILTPMFTSLKLKKMEDLMQHCINSMMASFEKKARSGEAFEAREPMGSYTMDVIAKCAFATDTNAHEQKNNAFLSNAKNILSFNVFRIMIIFLLPRFLTQFLFNLKVKPIYVREVDFFLNLSLHLIDERRNPLKGREHSDMLQLMVNAEFSENSLKRAYQEDFKAADHAHHLYNGTDELEREQQELKNIIGSKFLSTEEIMAQALVFFLAGYETTSSLLSFCLYELALNPAIQQRLYEEIQSAKSEDPKLSYGTLATRCAYLDAVISETLRKYPPALLLNRELSAEEYHIAEYGITLERGQPVNIPVYSLHHMEQFWSEPERFNPERFMGENRDRVVPFTYVPFGAGPRSCIGMRFALTEAKMGLAHILDRYQIVRAPETTDKLDIKAHDYDNNDKIDGLELMALILTEKVGGHQQDALSPEATAQQMQLGSQIIDRLLDEEDLNRDGFLDFNEYSNARARLAEKH
ncbi:Thromboxane-A synthase [Tyrophagus putrescentiae]|nr:Thromboxane-A synthase [Tyrophagus putrescentiae]